MEPVMPDGQSSFPFVGPQSGKTIKTSVLGVHLVEFTRHALERMGTRGVTEEDVLNAIRRPTETGLDTEPGNERIRWQKDRRTLIDVVYAKKQDRIGIITAWKTRRSLIRPRRSRK
jgi:hypothetical protein